MRCVSSFASSFRRLRTVTSALCLSALASLGCVDRSWETAYRLERAAPLALLEPERSAIDFGTEEARRHLIDGWSFNESNEEGLTFVWSHGRRSSFGLFYFSDPPGTAAGPALLHLSALPFEAPDAPQQVLRLSLNSRPLGEAALPGGLSETAVEIPPGALHDGWNVFDIDYEWIRSDLPSQSDRRWRRSQRDLAVAWIDARLEHPTATSDLSPIDDVAIDLRTERLELPGNHLLEFELEIGAGFRIAAATQCSACADDARVDVYLGDPEQAALRFVGSLGPGTTNLPLEAQRHGTVRLVLRNPMTPPVVLDRPRVERPVPTP